MFHRTSYVNTAERYSNLYSPEVLTSTDYEKASKHFYLEVLGSTVSDIFDQI